MKFTKTKSFNAKNYEQLTKGSLKFSFVESPIVLKSINNSDLISNWTKIEDIKN